MASAPSAATRRIHSFEGGGGRSSGTTAQGIDRVGQGVRRAVLEKKTIDSNFAKKTDAFSEDEDEPLSVGRSTRDMEAAPRTPAPSVAVASSTSTSRVGNTGSGSSGGAGTRGEGSALGAEKKRGISEAGRMVGSGGGTGPPLTKKLRVGTGGIIEKTKMDPDDEDEDDVPLAMRMKSKNVPSSDESLSSKLAAAKAAKKLIEEKNKGTSKGLVAMTNLTPNGDTLQGTASTGRRLSAEVQERTGTSVSRTRDETQQDRKIPAREDGRPDAGNSVPDSDDSDDDKPLSYRKSMTLSLGKGPKPENKEMTEAQMKKRSAGTISSPSNVKKLKVVASGRATPKLSVQSPKSGSLQSPRAAVKREADFSPRRTSRRSDLSNNDDDDDVPLAQRMMSMNGKSTTMKKSTTPSKAEPDSDEDDDNMPLAKRVVAVAKPQAVKKVVAAVKKPAASSGKSIAKKVLEQRRKGKGTVKVSKKVVQTKVTSKSSNMIVSGGTKKWDTLEHCGVIFPPSYQPHGVKMLYKGKPVTLTPDQEEIATMFAVMKDTDYATKPKFLSNFWTDWKPILGKNHVIQDFENCDFTPIYEWHLAEKEKKKSMTSEEKKKAREDKLKAEDKYMWALVNGVKEKVGNFRVEPPGLFRGRGEHPKMGKVKKRIFPENIVINVGKGAPIPECPMPGHKWKEVRHDDTVTWLAFWNDPINTKEFKYVFLAPSSTLKGQSDMEKYEKARLLKDHIENIRKTYTKNFGSQDPVTRQIAVATYLIDRLALRAGNEKDEDEAETVGCCSLKVEHVILVPPRSLTFDFLGKDSIRYFNTVEVEEKVYKAIGDFKKGKRTGNDLFDKLDTSKLNTHLKGIMPALTAKVFRTYNASITLDNLLQDTVGSTAPEKVADYQRANKEVAILCNHQRTVSKSHSSQMEKLEAKMAEAEDLIKELKVDLDRVKKGKPPLKDSEGKPKKNQSRETLERKIAQTQQRVEKMKLDMRIKDDLKTVALGTSKINYMDPRISVAWCKRHEVPIEKVFNKSLLAKFAWAMDVEPDYRF